MHVDAHITVLCEAIRPRCTFAARMYDRALGQFFSGHGDTAWEAVCWALDAYVRRGVLGLAPSMSRRSDEVPGETLASPWTPRVRIAPTDVVFPGRWFYAPPDSDTGTVGGDARPASPSTTGTTARRPLPEQPAPSAAASSCFDAEIPRRPALVLHDEAPPAPARARRSR